MSWKLTRHHRPYDEEVIRVVRDEWVRPERGMLETEAVRDANEVYGGKVGEPEWQEMEMPGSPVGLIWIVDEGLWYSLVKLAEELEGE